MPKIAYRTQRFNAASRKTVEQAKVIIDDLSAQGYTLTLRQLYYQMVSRNFIPNKTQAYKRLGSIICDAREIGEIDWYAIEDRGRGCYLPGHTPTPEDVLAGIEQQLRLNPWLDQDVFLVVGVEKAALEGVISLPAKRWRAPYMSCKGYLSASEAWRTGRRFEAAIAEGKRPIFLHLGDHDPSGLHMTDDNRQRMSLFAREGSFNEKFELVSGGIEVDRLALHMHQVEEYKLPENPAKESDTRYSSYKKTFGTCSSWELDALPPQVLDNLIHESIKSYVDQEKWEATLALEAERRQGLRLLGLRWEEVQALVLGDELNPHQRAKALDAILAELPYQLGQCAHYWPQTVTNQGQAAIGLAVDAVQHLVTKPDFEKQAGFDSEASYLSQGFDTAMEASAAALAEIKLPAWSEDAFTSAYVRGLTRVQGDLEAIQADRESFEAPEPIKPEQSPFEALTEASDEDDGYTSEEPLPEGFKEDI